MKNVLIKMNAIVYFVSDIEVELYLRVVLGGGVVDDTDGQHSHRRRFSVVVIIIQIIRQLSWHLITKYVHCCPR